MIKHLVIATAGTTGRFTVILAFLTALLGLLGVVVRTAFRIGHSVIHQIEAIDLNTRAVRELAGRIDKLENSHAD